MFGIIVLDWCDKNIGKEISKKIQLPKDCNLQRLNNNYLLHNVYLDVKFFIGFPKKYLEESKYLPKDSNLISKEFFEKNNIKFLENSQSNKKMWEEILKDFDPFCELITETEKLYGNLCGKIVDVKEKYKNDPIIFWDIRKLLFNKSKDPIYVMG